MKKMLSVFLATVMLFTCLFSSLALAETAKELTQAQQAELTKVVEWLLKDLSEEEYIQLFSWDRDTILKKLENYDQPLETLTKEEIADNLSMVISMFSFFTAFADGNNGEGLAASLFSMIGSLTGGSDDGTGASSGSSADLSGALGLLGGLTGSSGASSGGSADLSGLTDLFGGSFGGSSDDFELGEGWVIEPDGEEYIEEEYKPDYSGYYDGFLWVSGDLKLESVWQDEYYKIAITGGDKELAYLCELDAATGIATGIGAGDPETTEAQPDHGIATFCINEDENLIWKKADGEEVVFTPYESPLSGLTGYGDGKDVTITWWGNYFAVTVQEDDVLWYYACALNEETDTLAGRGWQGNLETDETVEGFEGTFVFRNDRTQLVWTDSQVPAAQNGLTFEMYEPLLDRDLWSAKEAVINLFKTNGYYFIHIFTQPDFDEYGYLCTYDRATRTLTALDPAAIDFDSLTWNLYRDVFTTTATFVLEDDDHLVWHDDSGVSGDGVVFVREPLF